MTRRLSLLVLVAMLASASAQAGSFIKSFDEAQKIARSKNQLIFVDLFAEWCGWCHRFEKEIVPTPVFQKATKDMVLLRVDTEDRAEGTALAREFSITRLPTFIVLTSDKRLAAVIQGYAPAPEFVNRLETEIGKFEAYEASLQHKPAKAEDQVELVKEMLQRRDFVHAEQWLTPLVGGGKLKEPSRGEAVFLLAMAQSKSSGPAKALATLKPYLATNPKGTSAERAYLLRAEILVEQKNFTGALAEYRAFKKAFPQSAEMQRVNYFIPQLEAVIARNGGK